MKIDFEPGKDFCSACSEFSFVSPLWLRGTDHRSWFHTWVTQSSRQSRSPTNSRARRSCLHCRTSTPKTFRQQTETVNFKNHLQNNIQSQSLQNQKFQTFKLTTKMQNKNSPLKLKTNPFAEIEIWQSSQNTGHNSKIVTYSLALAYSQPKMQYSKWKKKNLCCKIWTDHRGIRSRTKKFGLVVGIYSWKVRQKLESEGGIWPMGYQSTP